MKDDLRKLVEQDLPKLAQAIIRDGLSKVHRYAPGGASKAGSNFHPDIINPDALPRFIRTTSKADTAAYEYHAIHRQGRVHDKAKIIFFNVNIVDIDDIETGSLQDLGSQTDKNHQVDETINGGSEPILYKVNVSESKTEESEESYSASLSLEYQRQVEATAGIKIAEAKVTETLTAKAEASASGEWRKSDSLSESVDKSYKIPAKTHWILTNEKSVKHIRQDCLVTGLLECAIHIDSWKWFAHDWWSIRDLQDQMRGLSKEEGNVVGRYWNDRVHGYQVPDKVLEAWPIPRLTLNIPIEGKRTRYSKAIITEQGI